MTRARTLADLLDSSGDVRSSRLDNATSSLSDLSVTATASELNTLDGITATTAELNLMDGVTATTAEINYLDGVTSNVQTQIDGISSEVVDDTTPSLGGDLSTNGNDINFGDNDKAQFGASNDLQIYHDGSSSKIVETGTGSLQLGGTSSVDILSGDLGEYLARFHDDGAVELRYDNGIRMETYSNGIKVQKSGAAAVLVGSTNAQAANLILDGDSNGDGAGGDYGLIQHRTDGNMLYGNYKNGVHQFNGTGGVELMRFSNSGWHKAPAGTVLQVKSTTGTGVASYNNSNWNTISSLSITPKSTSSKILVIATITFGGGTIRDSWNGYHARMRRGNVTIAKGTSTASNQTSESTYGGLHYKVYHRTEPHTQQFLDSPSTTGAVTYSMQVARTTYVGGTIQFNQPSNRSTQYTGSGVTTLTLMEIAG